MGGFFHTLQACSPPPTRAQRHLVFAILGFQSCAQEFDFVFTTFRSEVQPDAAQLRVFERDHLPQTPHGCCNRRQLLVIVIHFLGAACAQPQSGRFPPGVTRQCLHKVSMRHRTRIEFRLPRWSHPACQGAQRRAAKDKLRRKGALRSRSCDGVSSFSISSGDLGSKILASLDGPFALSRAKASAQ